MREAIIYNLNNPGQLEKMYRENKTTFKHEFNAIYPDIRDKDCMKFWYERLNFETEEISWGAKNDLIFVLVLAFFAGLVAKLPQFFSLSEEYFYPRNISFIVFPFLTLFFAWKQGIQLLKLAGVAAIFIISAIFINMLPGNVDTNDTTMLACMHLPLFLWSVLGFTFVGVKGSDLQKRLEFLRYNGDLVVLSAIMLISGGILTGVTIGLFELIDIKIEEFYFEKIGIWGLSAIPIIATFIVRTNPQLVSKVSPVIARIFTPLILVTLMVYLTAVIYTGKDPYNDREFLMIFNVLLIGVMAIILFSIAELANNRVGSFGITLLFALSIVTIIVNGIALSAILFRISEWGITPNRLAVLGGNVLMLTNLLLVTFRIFKGLKNKNEIPKIETGIASFLPAYVVWTCVVIFIMPFVFGFR